MINFKKKFFALGCTIASVLTLVGCGNNNNQDTNQFVILHNWTREGIKHHSQAGADIGPMYWFGTEGLAQFVRVTDEIEMMLAESFTHHPVNDNGDIITRIKLRDDAKWQNGDPFVAMDVLSYYWLHHTTLTRYILKLEAVDDKNVDVYWNPRVEPNEKMKDLMLSQDKVGTVQYKEFKKEVDAIKAILDKCPIAPSESKILKPFNRLLEGTNLTDYFGAYQKFRDHKFEGVESNYFVATGPYMLEKITATQMLLTKNPNYYFKDRVKFDSIKCINGINDLTTKYAQLESGAIDYADGTPPVNMLNSILNKNKDLVHYKMIDPGQIGIVFNLEKDIWSDKVRQAFQYIFDREEVKNIANAYGTTVYYPMLGMCPSEAEKNMSADAYKYVQDNFVFSHNEGKAEQLLKEEGWQLQNGKWYRNGSPIELLLGYSGATSYFKSTAEAVASQLNSFGIKTSLKREGDWGTFHKNATKENSQMDFTINFTDLNLSFGFPGGSFRYVLESPNAELLHLPKYKNTDKDYSIYGPVVNLELTGYGGNTFKAQDYYDSTYSIKDDEKLTEITDDLIVGIARENYGVSFFENVTGSFYNISKIGGLPYENRVLEERNSTYIPKDGEDFKDGIKCNLYYSQALPFLDGTYYPKNISE